MSTELKITKEAVLAAAAKCNTAKETLKTLFPEVFKVDSKPIVPRGWQIDHPNGREMLMWACRDLESNHILLGVAFDFEIVQSSEYGGKYLKVTPNK